MVDFRFWMNWISIPVQATQCQQYRVYSSFDTCAIRTEMRLYTNEVHTVSSFSNSTAAIMKNYKLQLTTIELLGSRICVVTDLKLY